MKIYTLVFLLACLAGTTSLFGQQDSLRIQTASTRTNGSYAWADWKIQTSLGEIDLQPVGNAGEWSDWVFYKTNGDKLAIGVDVLGKWDAWSAKIYGIEYFTSAQGGTDEAWTSWHIESGNSLYTLNTRYSGADAWQGWELRKEGVLVLEIDTRYTGVDAWQYWDIKDHAPFESLEIKLNALFMCLFSSIIPEVASTSQCQFDGKKLYGPIRIVKQNPDLKIKYVTYGADLKVEFVNRTATKCGEWQEVYYNTDALKVQVVDSNEDLKVQRVYYNPGLK